MNFGRQLPRQTTVVFKDRAEQVYIRITRKMCKSTYSLYHNLKVWIYFLSGQAKSLGGGRCWLWLKSTHTVNLDPILKCLHVIGPP